MLFGKKVWRFFCINSPLPTTYASHSENREAKSPFCQYPHFANPNLEANYISKHQEALSFEKELRDKNGSCVVVTSTLKSVGKCNCMSYLL